MNMMNMDFKRKLPIPMETKEMYPLSDELSGVIEKRTAELKAIFEGESDKMALIIGPCSADNEDSVLDYVSRLVPVQEKVADKLLIVPRVYTHKARTTGDGYKGLVHQPDPNAQPDLFKGIIAIARSVENQQHRLTASAVGCPVGMKNPTSGDLTVMMNAIAAAQRQHDFIYRGWEGRSAGNPHAHAILRGYVNRQGVTHPNYHYETLQYLASLFAKWSPQNPAVIIDCNHSNSGKNPFEQPRIMKEVLHSCRYDSDLKRLVKGFMVESYIEDGSQPVDGGVYGKSITDACLGWEKSERLIYELAELL